MMTNNDLSQLLKDVIQNKDKLDGMSKEELRDLLVTFSQIILKYQNLMEKTVTAIKETMPLLDHYDLFLEQYENDLYWQGAFITDK